MSTEHCARSAGARIGFESRHDGRGMTEASDGPGLLSQHRGGSGPSVVLLHGIGGSWRQWSPVLAALEGGCEVLALDLPGFGESPPRPGVPATIPGQADAVEAELDSAGLSSAHLVGNSSGGWLALELARRGRARTVVALSPAGMWTAREDAYRFVILRNAHYAARLISRVPALTRTPARRLLLNWWLFMARPGQWSAEQAAQQMRMLGGAPSYMDFLEWTRGRRVEGLGEVTCPVLVAWGSRDLLLPRRQAVRFVRELPDAELRILPGAGHLPMADAPQLIASTILDFIGNPGSTPLQHGSRLT